MLYIMCIYIYVYIYIYIDTHTCVCIYIYIYAHTAERGGWPFQIAQPPHMVERLGCDWAVNNHSARLGCE